MKVKIKLGIDDENANFFVKNSYDIIMELVRAEMWSGGFNSSGVGSHKAEVSYLRKIGLSEKEVRFVDQLRYFRNGIAYYGKDFDKKYAEKVVNFLDNVYYTLRKRLNHI